MTTQRIDIPVDLFAQLEAKARNFLLQDLDRGVSEDMGMGVDCLRLLRPRHWSLSGWRGLLCA